MLQVIHVNKFLGGGDKIFSGNWRRHIYPVYGSGKSKSQTLLMNLGWQPHWLLGAGTSHISHTSITYGSTPPSLRTCFQLIIPQPYKWRIKQQEKPLGCKNHTYWFSSYLIGFRCDKQHFRNNSSVICFFNLCSKPLLLYL